MKPQRFSLKSRAKSGQTLILFVFFIIVLLLFVGLAVDLGFAYVTKAQLSKAVDAAALTGARNITSADVNSIVQSTFAMNYGRPGRDAGPVTPTVDLVTDETTKQRRLQVGAATTINTFFIRILPNWRTLTVAANAEATRSRVIMSIILDKSYSMVLNGGCSQLPWATDKFIGLFNDNADKAAAVTFSTVAETIVTMRRPFMQAISNAVPRNCSQYIGATFMQDGLQQGYDQIINESPNILPGENVIKAAVFFTDGLPNIIQETWACGGVTTNRNIGGYDRPKTSYGIFNPIDGSTSPCGTLPSSYNSMNAIRTAAENRTKNLATQMRQAGIIVYTIGLKADDTYGKPLLRDMANVGATPSSPIPHPGEISGVAVFPANAAEIENAFLIVGSDLLGRLTQ